MADAENMELGEFITNVLSQIAIGIKDANEAVKTGSADEPYVLRHNIGDSAKIPGVRFDVAVSIRSGKGGTAQLGVEWAGIGAGAKGGIQTGDEQVHRIQFEVGLRSNVH